jgi:IclR family transcriptional regulator, acetate operon repressor
MTATAVENPYSVRAVLRVLDIFDLLRRSSDGATLAEIGAATDLPKSSVFRYLATLEARGYVERDPEDGTFRLGFAFFPADGWRLDTFVVRARPFLEELRDALRETINLGVLKDGLITYLDVAESPHPVRFITDPGKRNTIHSTALGKAIAASLPEAEVRRILAATGMPRKTPRTITDPDAFIQVLAKVRRQGYAIDDNEDDDGCRCVAVPIPGSPFRAAISLSAPSGRLPMRRTREAAAALIDAASRLGRELHP